MRYPLKWIVVPVFLCIAASGCATMRYPSAYKVEGREFREFKDLNDEQALKVVALIYNVQPQNWEDGIARSLALEKYLELLSKRNSKYVRNSGIFDMKYDKVNMSSWKNEDLIKLYDYLDPKARSYYVECAPELTEAQNTRRIVYLTAINFVVAELKKRDLIQKATMVAGQVLMTALSVALAMI